MPQTLGHLQRRTCGRVGSCCTRAQRENREGRRAVLALLPALLGATVTAQSDAVEVEPFLKSTGARGFLADEEAKAIALRKEKEMLARDELERERMVFEQEARTQQRGLCAALRLYLHSHPGFLIATSQDSGSTC